MNPKVYRTLVDACEEFVTDGKRQSAETILGRSTVGPFDTQLGAVLVALARYADDHAEDYGAPLVDNVYLGKVWEEMLQGFVALLNGKRGRIDGGNAWHAADLVHKAAGFTREL